MTKGDRTKKKLYDCAIRLFQERGYENVSVSEIVKAAGTAKGTFYIYFSSKSSVLIEMIHEYDDYYDRIAASFRTKENTAAKIKTVLKQAGRFTQDVIGCDLIRVLYADQISDTAKNELYTERSLYRIIGSLLQEGKDRGDFRSDFNVRSRTDDLVNWVRGTFFEWAARNGTFDLSRRCESIAALFCDALH